MQFIYSLQVPHFYNIHQSASVLSVEYNVYDDHLGIETESNCIKQIAIC